MPKVLGLVTGLFCVVTVVQACGSDDGKRVTRQDAGGGEAGAPLGGNGAGGDPAAGGDAGASGDPGAGGNAQGGVANEPVGGEATGGVAQGGATETPVVAPSFSTQPTNQSVVEPATATFTVVVGGSPVLKLQWQVSTDGGGNWVDIAGATGASYTTAATALADSGTQYRVVATNGAGSVVSAAATLTVTLASALKANTIAAGYQHTCAIRANGSLACWGYNSSGQIGNGNRIAVPLPTTVSLPEATIGVAAGYESSCALGSSGTVRCWGDAFGSITPVVVGGVNGVEVGGGIKEITVGRGHACVLTVAGNVWCRGSNSVGQLGNGTTVGGNTLVQVQGAGGLSLTDVTGVSAIDFHTCARRGNGSVMCWGQDAPTPSLIAIEVGDMTDATHVSGDCAVVSGTVLCWSGIAAANPLPVAGLANITRVGFGGPNCAIVSGGTVQCWGSGLMGNGQLFEIEVPPVVVSQQNSVGAIATGGGHTCLLRTDAALRCWGSGQYGQLGVGDTTGRSTPTNVPDAVGWAAP